MKIFILSFKSTTSIFQSNDDEFIRWRLVSDISTLKQDKLSYILETMITSWTSSIDGNNPESISSSSIDKNQHGKSIHEQEHSSSEGSIFSDSDIQQQQQDESTTSPLVNFERGPSFLIPNV